MDIFLESYTGLEPGLSAPPSLYAATDDWYCIRPLTLPWNAVPIMDSDMNIVVGYVVALQGISRIYDIHGEMVGIEELPLEAPPIDPTELIFIVSGLLRAGLKWALRNGVRSLAIAIGTSLRSTLRARLFAVKSEPLKFTVATLGHMNKRGRFVPIQILGMAIKHGTKMADPQGALGATKYLATMVRNGKSYSLEVVLRESDRTVLHFH